MCVCAHVSLPVCLCELFFVVCQKNSGTGLVELRDWWCLWVRLCVCVCVCVCMCVFHALLPVFALVFVVTSLQRQENHCKSDFFLIIIILKGDFFLNWIWLITWHYWKTQISQIGVESEGPKCYIAFFTSQLHHNWLIFIVFLLIYIGCLCHLS